MYLHARPLTGESFDRYTLLRKPSLLLGNVNTNYVNHAQIWYVWGMKHSPSGTRCPGVLCMSHMYLLCYTCIYMLYVHLSISAYTY